MEYKYYASIYVLLGNIKSFTTTVCYERPAICYLDKINPKVTLQISNTKFEDFKPYLEDIFMVLVILR